jgi:hypothetical protein
MFDKPWNIAAYGLSLLLLVLGPLLQTNVTAALAVVLFLAWDIAYLCSGTSMSGRTVTGAAADAEYP